MSKEYEEMDAIYQEWSENKDWDVDVEIYDYEFDKVLGTKLVAFDVMEGEFMDYIESAEYKTSEELDELFDAWVDSKYDDSDWYNSLRSDFAQDEYERELDRRYDDYMDEKLCRTYGI